MSHLRPNIAETGQCKPIADYTPEEKASSLQQMDDAARLRIAKGKPLDKRTASLMVSFAEGTEKADSLPQEVLEIATAPTKADGKRVQ